LAAVVLKLVPVMVTEVPTGPDAGEKELMVGCARPLNEMHKTNKKRTRPLYRGLVGVTLRIIMGCANNKQDKQKTIIKRSVHEAKTFCSGEIPIFNLFHFFKALVEERHSLTSILVKFSASIGIRKSRNRKMKNVHPVIYRKNLIEDGIGAAKSLQVNDLEAFASSVPEGGELELFAT
jgi:hypothetical protein